MGKENTLNRLKKYRVTNCLVIVVLILLATLYPVILHIINSKNSTYSYDLSSGWTYEDGTAVVFSELDKNRDEMTISRIIKKDEQRNEALCFFAKNIYFDVFLDGEQIYSFYPTAPKVFG